MLEFKNVTCKYGDIKVLKNLSFECKENEIVSILGANGSGKSTLLKSLMGINSYEGEIFHDGENLKNLSTKSRASIFSYVPQHTNIPFEFSVQDVVLMGRFHKSSFGFGYKKEDYDIVYNALQCVGALMFIDRLFKYLSGGERQLVLLARAVAQGSKIIVLDEPTTGLDLGNQMRLLDMLVRLKENNHTIIQTTHYPDHALRISSSVIWLHEKEIFANGDPRDVVTAGRICDVYGVSCDFLNHKEGHRFVLPLELIKKEDNEKDKL